MKRPLRRRAPSLPLGLAFAVAWLAWPEAHADTLLINNGLAPPVLPNLIFQDLQEQLVVRNLGCFEERRPCLSPRDPTRVSAIAGRIGDSSNESTEVRDSSLLLVAGATLGPPPLSSPGLVRVLDQARFAMTSGSVEHSVFALDLSRVHLDGGVVERNVQAYDRSQIEIRGATVEGPMVAKGLSLFRITSGTWSDRIDAFDEARVVLAGGSPTSGGSPQLLRAFEESVIEVVGSGFAVDGSPVPYGVLAAASGVLTGTLANGDPIEVRFYHADYGAYGYYTGTIALSETETPLPDADGDGVPDRFDHCIDVADPAQEDRDLDGLGDACNDDLDPDGDEYVGEHDTCPDLFDPEQLDTDRNRVGDLCNDAFDLDGDEFEDDNDTCPDVVDPEQVDTDRDSRGDACDLFPDDRYNLDAQVELERAWDELADVSGERDRALEDLEQCLDDPPFLDEDGDGEHDRTDRCPATPAGEAVDGEGCSRSQFCAAFGAEPQNRRVPCHKADWRNDQPLGELHDCRQDVATGSCVAD